MRAVDVLSAQFRSESSDSNLIMATGEAIEHLNYLVAEGTLAVETDDNVLWYQLV